MKNASDAILLDTNVLVYAYDPRDHAKQEIATAIVDGLIFDGRAVLSVQCLTEFFNTVTRRLPESMKPERALISIGRLSRSCQMLDLTPTIVLEGCRGATEHGLHLWDGIIWASAKLNQVPIVLTEDAPHGRVLEGVRFMNPFSPAFDPSSVGMAF